MIFIKMYHNASEWGRIRHATSDWFHNCGFYNLIIDIYPQLKSWYPWYLDMNIYSRQLWISILIQHMELCGFSLPISLVMTEIIYTLSYDHHQIESMNYYPLFRVRSWSNGMRCMSFYILMLIMDIHDWIVDIHIWIWIYRIHNICRYP